MMCEEMKLTDVHRDERFRKVKILAEQICTVDM